MGSNGQGITEKPIPLTSIEIEYMLIYGVAEIGNFLNIQ